MIQFRVGAGLIRIVALIGVAVATLLILNSPATAHHCGGYTEIGDGEGGASYACHGNDPGRPPSPGASASALWARYCPGTYEGRTVEFAWSGAATEDEVISLNLPLTGEYDVYLYWCELSDGSSVGGGQAIFSDAPPVDPEVLRDAAAARIRIEPPTIGTNPPFNERPALVQLETWLWTTDPWEVRQEFEEAGFIRVDVFARPDSILWEFGDGGSELCAGPGIPWSETANVGGTDCSYTFTSSTAGLPGSATSGSATISWIFSWAINGADQGDFGTVTATTLFSIQVGEIQAVETGG